VSHVPTITFGELLDLNSRELLADLADVMGNLATLHTEIAFLKAEEVRDKTVDKTERLMVEGDVAALEERKWFIIRVLETRAHVRDR